MTFFDKVKESRGGGGEGFGGPRRVREGESGRGMMPRTSTHLSFCPEDGTSFGPLPLGERTRTIATSTVDSNSRNLALAGRRRRSSTTTTTHYRSTSPQSDPRLLSTSFPSFLCFESFCHFFAGLCKVDLETNAALAKDTASSLPGLINCDVLLRYLFPLLSSDVLVRIRGRLGVILRHCRGELWPPCPDDDPMAVRFEELWLLFWRLEHPASFPLFVTALQKQFPSNDSCRGQQFKEPSVGGGLMTTSLGSMDLSSLDSWCGLLFHLFSDADAGISRPAFFEMLNVSVAKQLIPSDLMAVFVDSVFAFKATSTSSLSPQSSFGGCCYGGDLDRTGAATPGSEWWMKEAAELQRKMDRLLSRSTKANQSHKDGDAGPSSSSSCVDRGVLKKASPQLLDVPLSRESSLDASSVCSSTESLNVPLAVPSINIISATPPLSSPAVQPMEACLEGRVISYEHWKVWAEKNCCKPLLALLGSSISKKFIAFDDASSAVSFEAASSSKALSDDDPRYAWPSSQQDGQQHQDSSSKSSVALRRSYWNFLSLIFFGASSVAAVNERDLVVQPPLLFSPKLDGYSITQLKYLVSMYKASEHTLLYIQGDLVASSQGDDERDECKRSVLSERRRLTIAVLCPPGFWSLSNSSSSSSISSDTMKKRRRVYIYMLSPRMHLLQEADLVRPQDDDDDDLGLSKMLNVPGGLGRERTRTVSSATGLPRYHHRPSPMYPYTRTATTVGASNRADKAVGLGLLGEQPLICDANYGIGILPLEASTPPPPPLDYGNERLMTLYIDHYFEAGSIQVRNQATACMESWAFECTDFELYGFSFREESPSLLWTKEQSHSGSVSNGNNVRYDSWLTSFPDSSSTLHKAFVAKRRNLAFAADD